MDGNNNTTKHQQGALPGVLSWWAPVDATQAQKLLNLKRYQLWPDWKQQQQQHQFD